MPGAWLVCMYSLGNFDLPHDFTPPIRVIIQQPALPAYRVPVFRELARRPGIDLKVLYGSESNGPSNVEPDGFQAEYVPMREGKWFGQQLYWHSPQWTAASRKQCDVLILSWNTRYASLVPALLRAQAAGVPTILWGHGFSKQEGGLRSAARRSVARLATALLFYNRSRAKAYIDSGFDPARVFVGLNALDQTPIQAAREHWLNRPEELTRFREEKNLGSGPLILFVARLAPYRRADLLVSAAAMLAADYPQLKIAFIGAGDETIAQLKQLGGQLSVGDRLLFPGAIYDEMQLAPWFLSSDLVGFPFNIGLSLIHAFGYGCPVVTSDRVESQNPEIEALRHGENGLLFRHDDAEDLARQIHRVLSDPARRQAMSEAALRTATEEFTVTRMIDGFEAAIRYAAAQRRPSRQSSPKHPT